MTSRAPAMSAPVIRQAATRTDLEDRGLLAQSSGPEMPVSGLTLWRGGEDGASGPEAGVEECEKGPSVWQFDHSELVYVLAGTMTVAADGAEPMEVSPGDAILFPRGWSGEVHIHETMRKVYARF
ncbi:MAG: cupin domain-containing protein [Acidimicrobiales bacterium]